MSGTISDAKRELRKIYKKKVAVIPPHKPLQRVDQKDLFFKNAEQQYEEAVREVLERHETGQPVLVMTLIEDINYCRYAAGVSCAD